MIVEGCVTGDEEFVYQRLCEFASFIRNDPDQSILPHDSDPKVKQWITKHPNHRAARLVIRFAPRRLPALGFDAFLFRHLGDRPPQN
jgi:hypothetical protein